MMRGYSHIYLHLFCHQMHIYRCLQVYLDLLHIVLDPLFWSPPVKDARKSLWCVQLSNDILWGSLSMMNSFLCFGRKWCSSLFLRILTLFPCIMEAMDVGMIKVKLFVVCASVKCHYNITCPFPAKLTLYFQISLGRRVLLYLIAPEALELFISRHTIVCCCWPAFNWLSVTLVGF